MPPADRPLTKNQIRAATLMARGDTYVQIGEVCGVSTKSIQRWSQRSDFADIVRNEREHLVPALLLAQEALVRALSARKRDGSDDYQIQVAAAKVLMGSPIADQGVKEAVRATTIFLPDDEIEEVGAETASNGHPDTKVKLIGPSE